MNAILESKPVQAGVEAVGLRVTSGLLAGFVATLPMTIGMLLMHRFLPARRKKNLPPVEITRELTRKANLDDKLGPATTLGLSADAHFAYRAAVGALYDPLTRRIPAPPLVRGVGYGLLIWTVSYLGLMPALRLYPSAKDEPARMNGLMILAHVIWGAGTGLFSARLHRRLCRA